MSDEKPEVENLARQFFSGLIELAEQMQEHMDNKYRTAQDRLTT
jgi:hypothetical protein